MRQIIVLTFAVLSSVCGTNHTMAKQPMRPGLNKLLVFHPSAHERGLPAVRFEPSGPGSVKIDIPPTVHVHRYYYSGDEEYQGPILQGGPTVVVANHPTCGQRVYADVTLPAGAPIIAYTRSGITYVYPEQRVCLHYAGHNPDKVTVSYHKGQGIKRNTHAFVGNIKQKPHASHIGKTVRGVVGKVDQFANALPGYTALRSSFGGKAERQNQAMIRKASKAKRKAELQFVPTNR